MIRRTATVLAFTLLASAAPAGEQYVDATGLAVSGYDVVAYRGLAQSAVGAPQPPAVPGRADITAIHNGATFAFATEANRDVFLKDPAAYVPQFDGHCALGVAKGAKVPGNPDLWRIVDGKLYLNFSTAASGLWQQDIPGNLSAAGGTWPALDPAPASAMAVPDFTPAAPLRN